MARIGVKDAGFLFEGDFPGLPNSHRLCKRSYNNGNHKRLL
jgi:hypothetical protein